MQLKKLHLEVSASQYPVDRDRKVKITLNLFDMS